jgi:AraC family transcriptional regulator
MHAIYPQILLGSEIRTRRAGGFRLSEARYPPSARFAPHAHEHGNISLIMAGELEETVGRDSQIGSACSVVVKPAGTVHSNRFGPRGARTLLLEVPRGANLRRWQWFHGTEICKAALRVYRAFDAHFGVSCSATLESDLNNTCLDLLGVLDNLSGRNGACSAPPWIERVRDCLQDRFRQRISVSDLADEFGVHPVYLTRAFRARFGCAVTDYLQRLRVRDAAHCLASSAAPIAQVACRSGFADQAHLCRQFKRGTGMTPGQFRRLATGN